MNAQTMTLYEISNVPEPNSDSHSHLNFDDKDGRYYRPQSCQPTWKHQYQIYSTILWEHNILIYHILNAEFNIVLLQLKQTTFWERYHQVKMPFSQLELSPGLDVYLIQKYADLRRVKHWAIWSPRLTRTCLRSRHLHAVERHTRTMVFWILFLLLPPHFGDWRRLLHRCYRSESSDHRI